MANPSDPNVLLQQLQQDMAGLQAQFQGLSAADIAEINKAIAELRELHAKQEAEAAAASASAAAAAPAPVPKLKPAKPDTFSSVRASGRPEAWLFVVDTYLQAAEIPDPHTIRLVATLLRGSAALWWQSHQRSVRESGVAAITTWAAFQTAFIEQFAPVSNVRQARDRLRSLVQTKSVAEYTTLFRSLILQIPNASADEQLDRYVAGLKPIVRREVDLREPANLQDAMRLADRADTHLYRNPAVSVSRPAPAAPSGPVPMDIGAVQTGPYSPPLKKLTEQERDRLAKENRCFRCREIGHRARACPNARR